MKIVDLKNQDQYKKPYFVCLEEHSDEMKEAGDSKKSWYEKMKDKGLGVKLAVDEDGSVCGMIQYLPIEHSFAEGENLYVIHCIWVHGYKEGVGNRQKKGLGKVLLNAAEEDVKKRGAKGIAAWGVLMPFFMRAAWFKKQGYKKADRTGMMLLMWKPFSEEAVKPRWVRPKKKPVKVEGRVTVSFFKNGWCPSGNISYERTKRAAEASGEKVVFIEYDTTDRTVFNEWGIYSGLFIDNKEIFLGPPLKYEKIKKMIDKKVKKVQ